VLLRFMVADSYSEAAGVVPIVSAGYCFVGIWTMFTGYLINAGRTGLYAATIAFTAAVNIGASIILVARFGYIGAAWGTFIAFAAGAVITAVLAARVHPMPWLLRPRA
jgi:O-antigen/teichoic acid export membrane protein